MKNGKASSNGAGRYQDEKVRVAIIGVGNCASSFVQGVHYYADADPKGSVPGLMHVDLGGYHVRDIEFSAAFDIDADKVGKDLSKAIFSGQNNTLQFCKDVPKLDVEVHRGMTHRSEEHTSELQSLTNLVCRLLLEKKTPKSISSFS